MRQPRVMGNFHADVRARRTFFCDFSCSAGQQWKTSPCHLKRYNPAAPPRTNKSCRHSRQRPRAGAAAAGDQEPQPPTTKNGCSCHFFWQPNGLDVQ